MTPADIAAAAAALLQAERSGRQINLLSEEYPGITMDEAYAIQSALVRLKLDAGARQIGWKIGLTSKAMQYALNIDIPDSGVLLDDMLFANGAVVPAGRFIQPRIEAEIAFVMKSDLAGTGTTVAQVLAATDYVVPSLEILDTRILRVSPTSGKSRKVTDTIADNAANAGIVLGDAPLVPDATDLRWIGAIVSRNGDVEETGLGAGVLDHPAKGIAWLAERLAQYGDTIRAGDIVLSGSFIRPVEVPSGSRISADFGAFGTVACEFA